jgi:hypothetical protein
VHEGQDQADLLPVPLRQFADRSVGHDLEAIDKPVGQGVVAVSAGAGEPGDVLAAGQPREEFEVAGQVAGATVDLDAIRPGIEPEEGGRPLVGRCRASSIRMVVDLPAPFGPRKPKTWPGSTRRSRSLTAATLP